MGRKQNIHYYVCSFLLEGKAVQGVKLRRYIEAAARWAGDDVGGYCINTEDGGVFGEAWIIKGEEGGGGNSDSDDVFSSSDLDSSLNRFHTWIKGQHIPREYTNIKPTPIGSAYPLKAQVDDYVVSLKKVQVIIDDDDDDDSITNTTKKGFLSSNNNNNQFYETYKTFSMVRDDLEASKIESYRKELYGLLKSKLLKAENNTNSSQSHDGVQKKLLLASSDATGEEEQSTTTTANGEEMMIIEIGSWPKRED